MLAALRTRYNRLQRSGAILDRDYLLNHLVNRIPIVGPRMRAYAALGVRFDDVRTTNIALGVEMWCGARLTMGRRSTIGQHCSIDARGGVSIGDDVSVSREAMVLTATHEAHDPSFGATLGAVQLESRSWLGVRALILPGIRIGEAAIVGAGAVVTSDVEPYTIVAGNPAKPIGTRRAPLSYQLDWRPSWH